MKGNSAFGAAKLGEEDAISAHASAGDRIARVIFNKASVLGPSPWGTNHEETATTLPYLPEVRLSNSDAKSVLHGPIVSVRENAYK